MNGGKWRTARRKQGSKEVSRKKAKI